MDEADVRNLAESFLPCYNRSSTMYRAVIWFLFLITTISLKAYEPPATARPLRNIADLRKLSYLESKLAPPVELKATVISHLPNGFDAQDASGGIFFAYPSIHLPRIGDEISVKGNTTSGFHGPFVVVDSLEKTGDRSPPKPLTFRPDFIQTGLGDNRWVELSGLMVDVRFGDSKREGRGLLVTGQSDLVIRFRNAWDDFDVKALEELVGSSVKLLGSGAPLFNDQRQRIGSDFVCPKTEFVSVLAPTGPQSIVRLDEIGRYDSRRTRQGLVETSGTVTLIESPSSIVVQSNGYGARVRTLSDTQVAVGQQVALTGLPETEGYFVGLRYATLSPTEADDPPIAPVTDEAPLSHDRAFQLVSLSGRLIEKGSSFINLQVSDALVTISTPAGLTDTIPPEGSELRVQGVKCVDANAKGEVRSVTIALRSMNDISVLAIPSWWTPARLWSAVLVLALGAILFLALLLVSNHRVRKQTDLISEQIESNATLEERNRIARELHDTLSQGFSGVGYQLASVANHLLTDPERAMSKLEIAREMVEQSLYEARDSLIGLRVPTGSESLHFPQDTLTRAKERCDEAEVAFSSEISGWDEDTPLPPETAFACHRIILEAVTNALRHSEANALNITLGIDRSRSESKRLHIMVADNGIGFSTDERPPEGHFGLRGMYERAQELGAKLLIHSTPQAGTSVELFLNLT